MLRVPLCGRLIPTGVFADEWEYFALQNHFRAKMQSVANPIAYSARCKSFFCASITLC